MAALAAALIAILLRPAARAGASLSASLAAALAGKAVLAATASLLIALFALQALCLWRAPSAWMPSAITIKLAPGETLTLGRHTLAAPQADQTHLSLRRDETGLWHLRNLSATRQVILQGADNERRMGSTMLLAGQRFQIGDRLFAVSTASADTVSFASDGHQWRYDGATLYRDGRRQDACPDARMSARLLAWWNRWAPQALTVAHALTFGGNVHCDNRLGLAGTTPGAALLVRANGRLQFSAGNPDGDRAAVLLHDAGGTVDLREQELPLDGVRAIIVGHTRLQLQAGGDSLTMTPGRRVALFNLPELPLPKGVGWQWRQRALWHGEADAALIAGIGFIGLCLAGLSVATLRAMPPAAADPASRAAARRTGGGALWQRRAALLSTCAVLICGVTALAQQRAGLPPSAGCSLLLALCALWLWLALPVRLPLLSSGAAVLLAAGLLAQLELGLGADESSWLRYYQKSAAMLAIGTGLGGMWRLWAATYSVQLSQRAVEWLLMTFAAVALAALAAQVLWGDETGVFDLQPVELAKLALTALTAHCLALRFDWQAAPRDWRGDGVRWLQLAAPALLFLALLGMALVQVDDYSPLILLLVWSTALAFAYALAARHRILAALLVCGVLAAVGAVVWLRLSGSDDLIGWGFYADRFLVWLNPAEHPHTGQQLLQGARAVADGGWWGADHWLGLRTLGQPLGEVLRIPAVQDDFAPSFFLQRHGLAGGLLLWAAQATLVTAIVLTAARSHASAAGARHFRAAWAGRFRYFALCGGAAFLLGHLLLSWGTNLAIFPIMGQPMSFLSAGGSHLLFFLCPLLAFAEVSAIF